MACLGQPILATNITQAQAFCIASACLQVRVFTPLTDKAQLGSGYLGRNKIHRLSLLRNFFSWSSARYRHNQRAEQWVPPSYLLAQHRLRYLRRRRDTLQSSSVSDKQDTVRPPTLDKSFQEATDNRVALKPEIIYGNEVQLQAPSITSNSSTTILVRPGSDLQPEKESLLHLSDSSSVYANLNPIRTPVLHTPVKLNSNLHRNHPNYPKLHRRLLNIKLDALRSLNNKINDLILHLTPSKIPSMKKSGTNHWNLYRQF